MAEWKRTKLQIPDEVQGVLTTAADGIDAIATFLELVADALEVAAIAAQAALDTYTTLVNLIIDEIQNVINDLRFAGVYVLLDYPQDLNVLVDTVDPTVQLAGTILDPSLGSNDQRFQALTNPKDFQALQQKRNRHNPPSRDLRSYHESILRLTGAFDDRLDHMRPPFSKSAATVGVVIMAHSVEVATFIKLVRGISNLFNLDDIGQLNYPALGLWLD